MKIDPIKMHYENLNQSIKNTAQYYVEGRNILITCLCRSTHRPEWEIVNWLKENNIEVKDLDKL